MQKSVRKSLFKSSTINVLVRVQTLECFRSNAIVFLQLLRNAYFLENYDVLTLFDKAICLIMQDPPKPMLNCTKVSVFLQPFGTSSTFCFCFAKGLFLAKSFGNNFFSNCCGMLAGSEKKLFLKLFGMIIVIIYYFKDLTYSSSFFVVFFFLGPLLLVG